MWQWQSTFNCLCEHSIQCDGQHVWLAVTSTSLSLSLHPQERVRWIHSSRKTGVLPEEPWTQTLSLFHSCHPFLLLSFIPSHCTCELHFSPPSNKEWQSPARQWSFECSPNVLPLLFLFCFLIHFLAIPFHLLMSFFTSKRKNEMHQLPWSLL